MSTASLVAETTDTLRPQHARTRRRRLRWWVLVGCLVALVAAVAVSLSVGSRSIPLGLVWELLLHPDGSAEAGVLRDLRLPRTVVAATVGASLALAGAVMQALTRNPLADPGILGVTAGASLAVVLFVAVTGISSLGSYVWVALLGAGVATVVVQVLAGTGRPGASPARLALAGVAVSAALAAVTQTVILADQHAFNEFRFWVSGSLEGRGWSVLIVIGPLMLLGAAICLLLTAGLNALTLGTETAQALGSKPARTRLLGVLAVALLCGSATAAVGPIGFVGLAVPLMARRLVGHDQSWISTVSVVLGAVWLLMADSLARVVVDQEVPAGIVAAVVGAPVFIAVVSRRKVPSL